MILSWEISQGWERICTGSTGGWRHYNASSLLTGLLLTGFMINGKEGKKRVIKLPVDVENASMGL